MNNYDIRTIADFFTVPADRRAALLVDFAAFLECGDAAMAAAMPSGVRCVPRSFRWNDDGEVGLRATHLHFADGISPHTAERAAESIRQAIEPFAVKPPVEGDA